MTRFPSLRGIALSLAATSPLPAVAQGGAIVQPMTPNADRLSEQMRILGRTPNDLSALIEAGRLSGKLGDFDAALQLLARAERVAPADPRIRAARAATLVGMERPGEALALFDQAERAGVPMTPYAAERGLAYDLLGYNANAQRDYRVALSRGPDDELTRRLALSLGIDGDVAGATALLDPLLRQNDRAAWRVRAFVLAMSGDAAGADRITASMLPGFAAGLAPFFRRLPQLSAADRAFAVHFGRLAPTAERIADARFAPAIVPVPRAAPPVAVAAATPVVQQPAPTRRAPTAAERRAEQRRQAQLARQAQQAEAKRVADARAAQLAKAQADEAARRTAQAQADAQRAARQAEQLRLAEATRQEAVRVAARQAEERRIAAEALATRDAAAAASAPPVQVATTEAPVPVRLVEQAPPPPPVATAPQPVQVAAGPPPAPGFSAPAATPAASGAAATVAARSAANDEVLARIIRKLDIPAAELGVAPPVAPVAATPALPTAAEQAAEAEAARAAAQRAEAEVRAAAAKKAADAKKLADAKKAAEAKKRADARKAEAAAEAKKEAALRKADPERHWVQVAGGANVADLPKAWKALTAKAPALKTRQAWTTPLRFTNRLLAGPFRSDDEAQAFVNTLGKAGLSAFAFTSAAGQKVVRVPAA